jgi:hypothetical protein
MASNAFARDIISELSVLCQVVEEVGVVSPDNMCFWVGPLHQRDNHIATCPVRHPFICPFYPTGCTPNCTIHYDSRLLVRAHLLEYADFKTSHIAQLDNEIAALKALQVTGFAVIQSPVVEDGSTDSVYCGSVNTTNNKRDGLGVSVTIGSDCGSYCGHYMDDMRHGHGVLKSENGSVYNGMWVRDKRHGRCILFYNLDDESCYSGSYRHDMMHGQGKIWNTKSKFFFRGQLVNGVKHGQGIMTFACGLKSYAGMFVDDQICGDGVMTDLVSHRNLSGTFVNGKCTGYGTLKGGTHNEMIYSGDFVDDMFNGVGVLFQADGSVYTGEFVHGKKHGHGELVRDDRTYVGRFENDLCHGEGVVTEFEDGIPCHVSCSMGDIIEGSKMVFDLSNDEM